MSKSPAPFSDADLEPALVALAGYLEYPAVPDLSGAVRTHLEHHPRQGWSVRLRILHPWRLYPVLATALMVAALLVFSSSARSAVASWFHVVGVQIQSGGTPPGPLGHNLELGRQASLSDAQKETSFPILIPANLGQPDEGYVGTPPLVGSVSLLYRARPGLPRAAATGAGLLITEYQRRYFLDVKRLRSGTTVAPVTIGGEPGVWLGGLPHVMYDLDRHGKLLRDTIRLAGNVLVWYHGDVTVRFEGQISEQQAIEIARSMTPRMP